MIYLSQAAIDEVQRIRSRTNNSALLRLSLQAGGCADWSYKMTLEAEATATDRILNCDGIQVVVDSQSWPYLEGLQLDYSEDLMGGAFRFNNPHAKSSCGCGNSFSATEAPESSQVGPQYCI